MKKEKTHFNHIEGKILKIMYHHKLPYTIYEIAKEVGISYPTAKKYVEGLVKEDLLLKDKKNNNRFVFNYDVYDEKLS